METEIDEIVSTRLDLANTGSTLICIAVEDNNPDMLLSLVEAGHDINKKDNYGFTPLHIAVKRNNYDMATFLIQSGADVNIAGDIERVSPLQTAIFNRYNEIVRLLVANKADINIRNASGQSAMDYAVCNGDRDMCEFLADNGGDYLDPDPDGITSSQLATNLGNPNLARFFVQYTLRKSYL